MITKEKQYIRARKDILTIKCRNCGTEVYKNSGQQIIYFCSKSCRKEYKK